jgi:hypothetical protein
MGRTRRDIAAIKTMTRQSRSKRPGLWCCAALFLLMVDPGAAQDRSDEAEAQDQAEREAQRERLVELSCRDEQDRPESWLDRSHSYLSQRLCEPAAWFDGFFGGPRSFEETPVGTFIRLRSSVQWDEAEGWGLGLGVRANILLPRVSERVRLLIARDEVDDGFEDQDSFAERDQRTRLGLRFIASADTRSQLDIDGTIGVAGGGLNPRLRTRYRYVQGLSETTLARATQSAFWERDQGFGVQSRLDWEWLPSRDSLVRWTGRGTYSEASEGVDWRTSLIGFQQLDSRTAVRLEGGAFGHTRPDFEVDEYFVAFRFRRQFLRSWLFYELEPEYAWPLDDDTGQRGSDWRFTFTLEIQFENDRSREYRLRRYLGEDEVDLDDWSRDEPIPAEAPGDRALDPVLDDPDEEGGDG